MSDHQIEGHVTQYGEHVGLNVEAHILLREQVAGPGIVAPFAEGVANDTGIFAGDENM
jgi:hypothetical protein